MRHPTRRRFLQGSLVLAGLGLLGGCGSLPPGQQPAKMPRVGYLSLQQASDNFEAFRDGLRELGYLEGRTIVIEERWAESDDQLPALAAEPVGLRVDLSVTVSGGAIQSALGATGAIPIVFPASGDPVQAGYSAAGWERDRAEQPGGPGRGEAPGGAARDRAGCLAGHAAGGHG